MITPVLQSERILLKPVSMDHCSDFYVSWMNDPEVNLYLESGGDYSLDLLKNYLHEALMKKDVLFWAIHLRSSGKHIGNVKIDPIYPRHYRGELGILLGDKTEWGKGYGREATSLTIRYFFDQLKYNKLTLGVIEGNEAAIRLYASLGFNLEGTFRQHGYYGEKMCDLYRMAIFNPDFKQ
jgi:ribosomal-protein-alanine N-acetyltransferase